MSTKPKKSISEDLSDKLETLKKFTTISGARVYITDFFYSLRNELDIKSEELLLKIDQELRGNEADETIEAKAKQAKVAELEQHVKEINDKRTEMLNELSADEKYILNEFENIYKDQSSLKAVKDKYEYFEIKAKRLDEILDVIDELDNELVKIRQKLLLNKSYIFKPINDKFKLGVLLIVDIYLSNDEICLIK